MTEYRYSETQEDATQSLINDLHKDLNKAKDDLTDLQHTIYKLENLLAILKGDE